jgi:hypothetical protein
MDMTALEGPRHSPMGRRVDAPLSVPRPVDGFMCPPPDTRAVNRHVWAVAALVMLTAPLSQQAVGEASPPLEMYYHSPLEAPAPARSLLVLDSNVSANLSAFLLAPSVSDLHEFEHINLTLVHRSIHGVGADFYMESVGAGEGGSLPDLCLWGTDPGRRDYTTSNCTYRASFLRLALLPNDPLFSVRIHYGGDVVTLEWNATLQPARVLLSARLVLPGNQTSLPELQRVQASVVIGNDGGLDALDHVVDVRYAGRILTTWNIPLVPSDGSYSVPVAFVPVLGEAMMEVHLVSGEGAPYRIAAMPVDVRAAAVLTVDRLNVGQRRIEEGTWLTVMAGVTNTGNLTADGMLVQFLVDGGVVANATLDGLGPGNSTTVSGRWEAAVPGMHSVAARVEGEPLGALARSVEVTGQVPAAGGALAVLAVAALAALMRAGRR